jgi:hypothetical protein
MTCKGVGPKRDPNDELSGLSGRGKSKAAKAINQANINATLMRNMPLIRFNS